MTVIAAAAAPNARADDSEAVESFLERLGLIDLQILHLEKTIETVELGEPQQILARRLADLYAERLMDAADDQQRYDEILGRIGTLVKEIPEANTPALRVMLLQADYTRAETQIVKWINDHSEKDSLGEAREILARIAPALEQYHTELNKTVDQLIEEIDKLEEGDELAAKQQELARMQAVAGRATYFTGWANYYYGVAREDAATAKSQYDVARIAFRRLLGIAEDEKYEEVEAEWLGLESIWRSRALIGLGLTEAALDNLDGSRICFRLLEDIRTPPIIRDQGAYWYLQGLLNAGRLKEAIDHANGQIEKYTGGATQGKIGFCVALVRAGFADASEPSPEARQLGELGIRGLARLRQFGVIRQLMTTYNIDISGESGFYLTWIKGQQQFAKAEQTKKDEDYEAAAETLTDALMDSQAAGDVTSASQCRNHLAWCLYRLGKFEDAAREFEQAAPVLKETGDGLGAEAAWMVFVSYHRLASQDNRYVASAIDASNSLKRDFPNSDYAKKCDYLIARLEQSSGSLDDSIRTLSAIKPGEPNYLASRYDLCLLYHRRWTSVRGDQSKSASAAAEVRRAVDQYLTLARNDGDVMRKLKCALVGVEVAMSATPADLDNARDYLAKSNTFAGSLPESSSVVAEHHYWAFQLSKATSDKTAQEQHAAWLVANAPGSSYERAAIITMARAADEAVKNASSDQKRDKQFDATRTYGRLVELLGDSPDVMAEDKNARIANSRLAQYEYDLGQYGQAANRLDRILQAYPDGKSYLRRAALAHFRAGNFDAALEHWRKLVTGLPNGAEAWYEAKYYQMACLAKLDKDSARQVYRQFKLLHPSVKLDEWRTKFEDLERELSAG